MALTVSQALVAKLELNQAGFQTDLKKSVKSASSAGEKMRKGFKIAAVAVAAVSAAVVTLGIKLLNAGARAVATRSRFETVFGASTAAVDAFNKEFGKISGLSQQAFEDTIATTAAIAQGMGFAQDASAKFAIEITKVAGDLASFNGLRTEEVALAVNSALTGERESDQVLADLCDMLHERFAIHHVTIQPEVERLHGGGRVHSLPRCTSVIGHDHRPAAEAVQTE